jgi:hypothetical protein
MPVGPMMAYTLSILVRQRQRTKIRLRHEVPIWSSHFGKPAIFKLKSTSGMFNTLSMLPADYLYCPAAVACFETVFLPKLLGLRLCRTVRRYRPISRLPRKQRAAMMPQRRRELNASAILHTVVGRGGGNGKRESYLMS